MRAGAVVVDLRAVQNPDYRGRGIGRRTYEEAAALERTRPDVVGAYLLDPDWPPPGALEEIVGSGKVHYAGTAAALAACEQAAVYHCPSPIELGRTIAHVRPPFVDQLGQRYSVTVHDLIPLHDRDRYLAHPAQRRRYMGRLEVVRAADAVLAVSSSVAADVQHELGLAAGRCHAVGSGVSSRFVPPTSRHEARTNLSRAVPGISGPFVLFPAGNDVRKNLEVLITAFSLLPEPVRTGLGLVILGDYPPSLVAHYRHLAEQAGIARSLVLAGFVSDDTLISCYQAASLVAFPSLAEGYGLPVAEALACGAVCCVSDRPPLRELVADARARFDPTDPAEMAAAMGRCLADDTLQASLRSDARRVVEPWDAVVERVVPVWEQLATGSRRPWRRRRRLAVVSPFPPVPSGVARYSAALVDAMRRVDERRSAGPPLQIDCFMDGPDRDRVDPLPVGGTRPIDAAAFERYDGIVGGYENVLYVLGDSPVHARALRALRRRRGTVLAHGVRLNRLLATTSRPGGAVPGELEAAIERNYPGLPQGLGRGGRLTDIDAERYGVYLLKEVVRDAERCIVFSEAARRLASLDVGPELESRVEVVPFPLWCLTDAQRRTIEVARAGRGGSAAVISTFGTVDADKRPEALVEALARLRERGHDVVLQFVGPTSETMRNAVSARAAAAGVGDRVRLTGWLDDDDYLWELGRTDVAVQLRRRFVGECSITVGECLSAGVATVVSSTGWMGELPDAAVVKVDPECAAEALAKVVPPLLVTDRRRSELGESGESWARTQTFERTAEVLLGVLGV